MRPKGHAATLTDLLRLGACWLAAIVLLQALAAAQALGQGPLHRHREASAGVSASAAPHAHASAERHAHAPSDAAAALPMELVVDDTASAVNHAAFALTAALALMLTAFVALAKPDRRRHVWRAAPPWAWRPAQLAGPRRPPRRG
jgi:hypothetical protein